MIPNHEVMISFWGEMRGNLNYVAVTCITLVQKIKFLGFVHMFLLHAG